MPSYKFDEALAAGVPIADINAEAAKRIGYKYDAAKAAGVSDDDIILELRKRYSAQQEQPKEPETRGYLDQFGREIAGTGTAVADFISQAPKFVGGALGYALARAKGDRPTTAINAFESAQTAWRDPSQIIRDAGYGEDGSYTSETQGYKNVMKPFELIGEGVKKLATSVSDNPETQAEVEGLANIGMLGVGIPGLKPAAKIAKDLAWKVNPADLGGVRSEAVSKGYDAVPDHIANKAKEAAAKNTEGFTFNPATGRRERGSLYIDPLTNTIMDSNKADRSLPQNTGPYERPEAKVSSLNQLTYQAESPLVVFPDGTTMTRAEYNIQRGLTEDRTGVGPVPPTMTPRDIKIQDQLLALEKQAAEFPFKLTEEPAKVGADKTAPELPPEMVGRDVDVTGRTNPYFTKGIDPTKIDVESQVGTPQVFTKLAALSKDGVVKLNEPAIKADFESGFPYIFEKSDNPTSIQKNQVFSELGITPELFTRWIDTPEKYTQFLTEHEKAHLRNKDREGYPRTEDGKLDLMNPVAIAIEKRATVEALEQVLGIKTSPKAGVGGKQGGAVNFGFSEWAVDKSKEVAKKLSETDFAAELQRIAPGISDSDIKKLYREYTGDQISVDKPSNDIIRKIPGLKNEVISPELQTIEEMIPKWKSESDAVSSAGALSSNLSAGGRHVAQRTGNSFIDWNVENILGETRKAQVIVKEKQDQIKQEVNRLTKGLFNKDGEKTFVQTMMEMMKSEDTPWASIPESGKKLAETLRRIQDEVGLKVEAELRAQGINFKWRTNYLAHTFTGPYRVLAKDSSGNVIGVIAGKTASERAAAMEWVKERMPDVQFGMPEYNKAFDNAGTEYGKRYAVGNEILNSIKNESPISAQLQNTLNDFYYQTMGNYMGYKHHFKNREGVFGYEGGKGWKSAKENAYDMLEAQLAVIDHAYHWLAQQKLARDMQKINDSGVSANIPEAREYVNMYLDHAFGRLQDKVAFIDSTIKAVAEGLGIAPSAMKEGLAIARNFALVNVLSTTGNMFANAIQGFTHPNIGIAKAVGEGLKANPLTAKAAGFHDTWNVLRKKFGDLSEEGAYFYRYFKEHGVGDPHLVEHTIARKMVPTTGMGPVKKAVWETINGVVKVAEIEARVLGKYFIEEPEKGTRMYFAMTMAHYYKNAGLSLKEAAVKADKDTSTIFTDYTPQERAMIYQRMGELGKFTSTVSTYKMNLLNQIVTFKNAKNYAALAALGTVMYATGGLVGIPGMDEIEYGFNKAKGLGLYEGKTPKEMLLSMPDVVSIGPLSQLTSFGGSNPTVAIHRKFASDDVVPDSFADFLYPLASFWTNKISTGWNLAKTPTKENWGAFVREMVPGNAKYVVDRFMLTDKSTGITRDVNSIGEDDQSGIYRTPEEHRSAAVWGVPAVDEWKAKQFRELNRIDTKVFAERKKSLASKATQYLFDGNGPEFYKATNELLYLDPKAAKELKQKIETQAKSRGMTIQQYMEMKLAKGANSKPGMERFQKYMEMKGK